MTRFLQVTSLATAMALGAIALEPSRAHAFEVEGLGVGGDLSLGGFNGFAFNYGLGALELEGLIGMTLTLPENHVLIPTFGALFGVFYSVVQTDTTNLQIGGRIGVLIDGFPSADPMTGGPQVAANAGIPIEFDLRVEHRLDDHVLLNFQVGFQMQIWPDSSAGNPQPDFVAGIGRTGLVGGAGFRFFLEPLGPVRTAATAAPRSSPAVEPAAPPPATTTYGSTSTGSGNPDWE
jgi:hypothetical protein